MSELHIYHFYFFLICACTCSTYRFVDFASATVAHGIIVFLKKKSISYFINITYKYIFLNFGVISFIIKEMVSLFQLHTYKFGLVYLFTLHSASVCVKLYHTGCIYFYGTHNNTICFGLIRATIWALHPGNSDQPGQQPSLIILCSNQVNFTVRMK